MESIDLVGGIGALGVVAAVVFGGVALFGGRTWALGSAGSAIICGVVGGTLVVIKVVDYFTQSEQGSSEGSVKKFVASLVSQGNRFIGEQHL